MLVIVIIMYVGIALDNREWKGEYPEVGGGRQGMYAVVAEVVGKRGLPLGLYVPTLALDEVPDGPDILAQRGLLDALDGCCLVRYSALEESIGVGGQTELTQVIQLIHTLVYIAAAHIALCQEDIHLRSSQACYVMILHHARHVVG